jgi:hypothetical protein
MGACRAALAKPARKPPHNPVRRAALDQAQADDRGQCNDDTDAARRLAEFNRGLIEDLNPARSGARVGKSAGLAQPANDDGRKQERQKRVRAHHHDAAHASASRCPKPPTASNPCRHSRRRGRP